MKLSEIKNHLGLLQNVNFKFQDGSMVPAHFHVTEVGVITKHFIDCGGTVRNEKLANFQLWNAGDTEHRLRPEKLANIIALSERVLEIEDLDIEVEYQLNTIGKYDLGFDGENFILQSKQTNCLASDNCGISQEKEILNLEVIESNKSCCTPNTACC